MTIIILLAGASFSFLGTLVGLGGGVFMVPLLVLVAGFPLPMAVGSVALALFPSALISTINNGRLKKIDYKSAVKLEIPTIVGAWLGATLTAILPVRPLEFIFSAFIMFMAWQMRHKKETGKFVERFNNLPGTSFLGMLSGILAGLFGVGGGILKTPILLKVFKLSAKRAAATSLAMIMVTAIVSSLKHWQLGHIDERALPVVIGFASGSILGNIFGKKISDKNIQTTLSIAMFLAALAVLIHAIYL
tara:strand:+ start:36832 stop:37572 length:741 start_codon:yes stop_codon:yes gene_type:complete